MKTPLLLLALLAVALSGCTGGGGDDTGTTPPQDDQGRYVIELGGPHGLTFSPEDAVVPAGATVVWKNLGGFHNVVAADGSFDSGEASNDAWEYAHKFEEAGSWDYWCQPHKAQGMTGTVTVEAAA